MSNTYFSSDHHFGHLNIIRYCNRPYSSVEEMNESLVNNWNSVVNPEDTIYYLGDFSMSFDYVKEITPLLNGTKILIPGNHDHCHPAHRRSKKAEYRAIWNTEYESLGWIIRDIVCTLPVSDTLTLNLSHLPYANDTSDVRYPQYRPAKVDLPLLCGHVHEKWKNKENMINVGVDVWDYKPVSLETIMNEINNIS